MLWELGTALLTASDAAWILVRVDWRPVYEGILRDLDDAIGRIGGKFYVDVAGVHGTAHVLAVTWPDDPQLANLVLFSKLSQSANGWWGLPVNLYEEIARRFKARRVALFFTGRTRGFLLSQQRIDVQRERWEQRLSPAKAPTLSPRARFIFLDDDPGVTSVATEPPTASTPSGFLQYHVYERHLRGAPGFVSAAEAATMLQEIARRAAAATPK